MTPVETPPPRSSEQDLPEAIRLGARDYFVACRQRVEPFTRRHFRYPGAWHTNRIALGWDLLRAPLNLLWAPFYLLSQVLAWLLERAGLTSAASLVKQTPSGLTTDVQRHLARACRYDLLQLPVTPGQADPLLTCIVNRLDPASRRQVDDNSLLQALPAALHDGLDQYALSRTATADIGNSLSATLLGAFAFQKFTPGGIAVGLVLAGFAAREIAVHQFPLGSQLGGIWYTWFTPEPSIALVIASTALTLSLLAGLAALSGLLSDPLQSLLGIHQRRLLRMIDHLERSFTGAIGSKFRANEAWLARLLDLLDAARSQWP